MEFTTTIGQEQFTFSQINPTSFLVTGNKVSVIIYKGRNWMCADDVPQEFVLELGRAVDQVRDRGASHPGRP